MLYLKYAAVAYFSDELHLCDLNRFRARIGESASTAVWESLAILVALRLWRPLFAYSDAVGVRSDSHVSLSALASLSTSLASLNLIVCEIALDAALSDCALTTLTHIPGVSNTVADALSRVYSPDPKPWPRELDSAVRCNPPLGTSSFYLSRSPPVSPPVAQRDKHA